MLTKQKLMEMLKDSGSKHTIYNEEMDTVTILDLDGNVVNTYPGDKYYDMFMYSSGRAFKCLADDDVSLIQVLECKRCGAIIFHSYNEFDYEPDLRCPCCTDSKCYHEYYSAEDYENNRNGCKDRVEVYKKFTHFMAEHEERYRRRGNKLDTEIFKWKIGKGDKRYTITLTCNDITQSYIKGLGISIDTWIKDPYNDAIFRLDKTRVIPLTISRYKSIKRIKKYIKDQYNRDYSKK